MATKKKLDAEAILRDLERMRKSIPYLDEVPASRPTEDGRTRASGGLQPRTAEEFEWLAVADGLESLANDLSATIRRKEAEVMERALEVYYAAEELARDPAHADLIPQVEAMRAAYERDFGRPIPPKKL